MRRFSRDNLDTSMVGNPTWAKMAFMVLLGAVIMSTSVTTRATHGSTKRQKDKQYFQGKDTITNNKDVDDGDGHWATAMTTNRDKRPTGKGQNGHRYF